MEKYDVFCRDFFVELQGFVVEKAQESLSEKAVKDLVFMTAFQDSNSSITEIVATYKGYLLAKKVYNVE